MPHRKKPLRGPRTTKQRAEFAIETLRRYGRKDRAFEQCFEMGDGDAVYQEIMRHADQDAALVDAINGQGFGDWLQEEYRNTHDPQMRLF